jgi:hypothetical protein
MHASGGPFRKSAAVRNPLSTACSAHRRPAEWNASRHLAAQNRCGEPPLRGSNSVSHQGHAGLIATAVAVPAPPSIMCSPNLARVPLSAPGQCGRERKHSTRTRIRRHRSRLRLIRGAGYARNLWPLQRRADRYCHPELRLRTGATSNRYAWFEAHLDTRAECREQPNRKFQKTSLINPEPLLERRTRLLQVMGVTGNPSRACARTRRSSSAGELTGRGAGPRSFTCVDLHSSQTRVRFGGITGSPREQT